MLNDIANFQKQISAFSTEVLEKEVINLKHSLTAMTINEDPLIWEKLIFAEEELKRRKGANK